MRYNHIYKNIYIYVLANNIIVYPTFIVHRTKKPAPAVLSPSSDSSGTETHPYHPKICQRTCLRYVVLIESVATVEQTFQFMKVRRLCRRCARPFVSDATIQFFTTYLMFKCQTEQREEKKCVYHTNLTNTQWVHIGTVSNYTVLWPYLFRLIAV